MQRQEYPIFSIEVTPKNPADWDTEAATMLSAFDSSMITKIGFLVSLLNGSFFDFDFNTTILSSFADDVHGFGVGLGFWSESKYNRRVASATRWYSYRAILYAGFKEKDSR